MDHLVITKKLDVISKLLQEFKEGKHKGTIDDEQTVSEKVTALQKETEILQLVKEYWRNMYDDEFIPELRVDNEMM